MNLLRALPALALGLALLLVGCAAPGDASHAGAPSGAGDDGSPVVHRGPIPNAPRIGGGPAASGDAVQPDRSCDTDADCTVKNVGNCCGYYPACVNVDSPTDPEGVQAKCAAEGRAGVCGFPEIAGCQCVQGSCKDNRREAMLE
ncbi:hypothetical protein LY625_00255 [Lysobacter sp. GX 14042]|uniref:hypothetical protein n=1 Tax=Lysobacter sp. GX 14042 TaxID=2907155 RepID=UPI001F216C78|nr:hypothetical protein [Lysobacter sp. GX 14042]MCE7031073.1 hypothetical protein [Lysobacter sp. GX 14042]